MPQWWSEFDDELSWLFTIKDSALFVLFAENSEILLKISVIPILLTFMYLSALNLLVDNQLNWLSNYSRTQLVIMAHNCHNSNDIGETLLLFFCPFRACQSFWLGPSKLCTLDTVGLSSLFSWFINLQISFLIDFSLLTMNLEPF